MTANKKYKLVKRVWTFIKRGIRAVFLPLFDELHYMIALSIVLATAILFYPSEVIQSFLNNYHSLDGNYYLAWILFVTLVAIWVTYKVFVAEKPGPLTSSLITTAYYLILATGGVFSLAEYRPDYSSSLFARANFALTIFIVSLLIIRALTALTILWFFNRNDEDMEFLGRSLKSTQYSASSLLIGALLGVVAIIGLRLFYRDEPITMMLLSYAYALQAYKISEFFFPGLKSIPNK